MKKLLILLLTTITILYAQTFRTLKRFEGILSNDSITWTKIIELDSKLTINKQKITIEGNRTFKLLQRISKDNQTTIYYAIDWEKLKCYVIIEEFEGFKYIYFQYNDIIIGYKIIEI